jgi:hypothetical protein
MYRMWIFINWNGSPLEIKFNEDKNESGHCKKPRCHHQQSVEDEPLVDFTTRRTGPGL